MGSLAILNVYEGDVQITYDTTNPAEVIRARRIIKDMLRRGYALLVKVGDAYQRAIDFDEQAGAYIIADLDPVFLKPDASHANLLAEPLPPMETEHAEEQTQSAEETQVAPSKRRGRRKLAMETTDAVAIARSAGG